MAAYYNEIDPHAAAWLRELIRRNLIAPGEVDERSIEDVSPADLVGFDQCHFFAGVGVWSYALRLAGWPDDRPVWTGSCPCQPFSTAGKGAGFADERHLWPAFHHLVRGCRPVVCFGEQVESKDGYAWLDLVCSDLEGVGYTVGAAVTPAAGFGAPHGRHRIYWVADAPSERRPEHIGRPGQGQEPDAEDLCEPRGMGDPDRVERPDADRRAVAEAGRWGDDADGNERGRAGEPERASDAAGVVVNAVGGGVRGGGLGPAGGPPEGVCGEAREQRIRPDSGSASCAAGVALGDASSEGPQGRGVSGAVGRRLRAAELSFGAASPVGGFWADADWLHCGPEPKYPGGRWRPVRPGSFPLAHGSPARVVRIRGYGNGLVAQQAAAFVGAYREARGL